MKTALSRTRFVFAAAAVSFHARTMTRPESFRHCCCCYYYCCHDCSSRHDLLGASRAVSPLRDRPRPLARAPAGRGHSASRHGNVFGETSLRRPIRVRSRTNYRRFTSVKPRPADRCPSRVTRFDSFGQI